MVNLYYPISNEFDIFLNIVNEKEETLKKSLYGISERVKISFDDYLKNFQSISSAVSSSFVSPDSDNLRHCYNSETIPLANLKIDIIKAQSVEFQALCPYCLINNHTTFDHYVSLSEFSEYGVLAKNLVPCCYPCNKHKFNYWRSVSNRKIIHFYNDSIPNVQFLFVNIKMVDNQPVISFVLQNVSGIVARTYDLITGHFERLKLLEKYDKLSGRELSDLKDDVDSIKKTMGGSITHSSIRDSLINRSNNYKERYGINYWRAILWEKLANTSSFISTL